MEASYGQLWKPEGHCDLLDDCIAIVRQIGRSCLVTKTHFALFLFILLTIDCSALLGKTRIILINVCCSTSCQTFESFAQPLQWILFTKFHVHLILFGPPVSCPCNVGVQSFLALATSLHIPVNSQKPCFLQH